MFFRFRRKTKICDLTDGQEAVIEGTVKALGRPLAIPKTTIRCVYYDVLYEAFEKGARGIGRKMWVAKSSAQETAKFVIDDGSEKIEVHLGGGVVNASGTPFEQGPAGKRKRFVAQYIPEGSVLRLGGLVDTSKKRGRKNEHIFVPDAKGVLRVHVKKLPRSLAD